MVGGVDPLVDEVGGDPGDTECQRHRTRHGGPQQQWEDCESDEEHGTPREDADTVDEVFLPGVMGQVGPTDEIPAVCDVEPPVEGVFGERPADGAGDGADSQTGEGRHQTRPAAGAPGRAPPPAALRSLRRARSTIGQVSVRSGGLSMSGLGGADPLDEENPRVGTGQLGPR